MSEVRGKIGPYRLEGLIGQGGMGVVYRGYDDRLERPVALKRLSRLDADNEAARRQLRREARAAARLNHPAIVQIHDIVSDSDGDWLVMEWVEGRTLAELAGDVGVQPRQAVELAQQLAAALAVAHARGIVHRDLKTQNVMVTSEGQVKILDFGLARHFTADATDTRPGERWVDGTVRAVSPEQALGRSLDPRSDLFSLGTLLYETVTGRSPFIGDGTADTLERIVTAQQLPAHELLKSVPRELSGLIDKLLEKQPEARVQSAAEAAEQLARIARSFEPESSKSTAQYGIQALLDSPTLVPGTPSPAGVSTEDVAPPWRKLGRGWTAFGLLLLAGLAAIAALRIGQQNVDSAPPEPLYVATTAPRILTGAELPEIELLPDAVRLALVRALVSLDGIAALTPERVDAVAAVGSPTAKTLGTLGRGLAADEVLASTLHCAADACDLTLSRVAPTDERILWTESFEIPRDDPGLLANAVAVHLRRAYPTQPWRRDTLEPRIADSDYKSFLSLRRDFLDRSRDLEALRQDLAVLRGRVPAFTDLLVLEAKVARYLFLETRTHDVHQQALDLLDQARRLAPGDPEVLTELFHLSRVSGDGEAVSEALDALEALTPGDTRLLVSRAWWQESRGQPAAALLLMRRAARRRPAIDVLLELANLELQHGETEAARRTLGELLERSPGNFYGQSLLAQVEIRGGDLSRAVELYSELARHSPGPGELSNLGFAQLLLGRYAQAVASLTAAFEKAPRHPFLALNLADAHHLAGDTGEAERLYTLVLELLNDPFDDTNWQFFSVRAQAQAHLGLHRQAVASLRQAQRLATDKPQAAYEAALVYVLVGDLTSAAVEAAEALRQGIEPRWFDLPWFDPLRKDPSLLELPGAQNPSESADRRPRQTDRVRALPRPESPEFRQAR